MPNIKCLLITICTTISFSTMPAISTELNAPNTTESPDENAIPQTSKEYISTTLDLKVNPASL